MELKESSRIVCLFLAYLQGTLGEAERQELDAWVNRSERNRAYFRRWCDESRQEEILAQIGSYDVTEGWRAVLRRRAVRRRRFRWRMAAAAAMAALLLGSGGLYCYRAMSRQAEETVVVRNEGIQPGRRQARLVTASGVEVCLDTLRQTQVENLDVRQEEGRIVMQAKADERRPAAYHCVEVPGGGEFNFKLPDGTEVALNAESSLRFPEYFTPGAERVVYLSGEAYFDVVCDTASPFLVRMEHTAVKVLGTSFNVSAYPGAGVEQATLVSGAVLMGQASAERWVALSPGQQGSYDVAGGGISRREVDVTYYTSWKNGIFAFDAQPLEQVMKTLARWYLFTVSYEEPALKEILYTGKVARHASIEEVLDTFELMEEVCFEVRGKEIVVRKKE